MPTLERQSTHFNHLRVGPKQERTTPFHRMEKGTVTLPGSSTCAANTTTALTIALPAAWSTPATAASTFDMVKVNPTAAMPAGLGIVGSYISTAGTARQGNPTAPATAPTAATLTIVFGNFTNAGIDAAGVYNVLLVRGQ